MRRAHTSRSGSPLPAESGGESATDSRVDLVAGDPPVPITVWRTPAGDDRASIPPRLAQRLVAAYSRPGETVIDITDDHALTVAARDGGRRHHRGWFTDASALIVGPPTTRVAGSGVAGSAAVRATPGHSRRRGSQADALELAAWFGDDLTDADLPGSDAPAAQPDDGVRGATSLVVTCWPLDAVDARNRKRLRALLRAAVALLGLAGCLVLVVRSPAAAGVSPAAEDFGPLVAAAREAGLGYLQHIVAVRADVSGDQFVYYATDEELLALARDAEQWRVAHLRVHADLLVFTPGQFPASSKSRAGGGSRG